MGDTLVHFVPSCPGHGDGMSRAKIIQFPRHLPPNSPNSDVIVPSAGRKMELKRSPELTQLMSLTQAMDRAERDVRSASELIDYAWLQHPSPQWIKWLDGRMGPSNYAYQRFYGISADDYCEATDAEQWGEPTAEAFTKNDMQVINTREAGYFVERVYNKVIGHDEDLLVQKYPVESDGKVVAVGGIVIVEKSRLRRWKLTEGTADGGR